jgi:thioredoxin-like negative regulator of GroEL
MTRTMTDVTSADFEEQVLRASQPVLVKVNIDEEPGLAQRYGVLSVPAIVRFDGGGPSETFAGLRPKSVLEKALGLCSPGTSRTGEVRE